MNERTKRTAVAGGFCIALLPLAALAFDSGSTGADGALAPPLSVELALPASGVLNLTQVHVPLGVVLSFRRNAVNTPVVLLVSGDVLIEGTLDVSGKRSPDVGRSGDQNLVDDDLVGVGGPGGFDGGLGGLASVGRGSDGLGPGAGGGGGAFGPTVGNHLAGGGGGGYATSGGIGSYGEFILRGGGGAEAAAGKPGGTYGVSSLLPLVGGSGGGGGTGGTVFRGSAGGGGGGAILIAASGTVTIKGSILANGGDSGKRDEVSNIGGIGGGGSGGAIRIVATNVLVTPTATVSAVGGQAHGYNGPLAGNGGGGRVRIEADGVMELGKMPVPFPSMGKPGGLFLPGVPSLAITNVGDVAVPSNPTGVGDVILRDSTVNPVAVVVQTRGIPVGTVVRLTVVQPYSEPVSIDSAPTAGTIETATTSTAIAIQAGESVLSAQTTFSIAGDLGSALSKYAGGEVVERIRIKATLGGSARTFAVTHSGKEIELSGEMLALISSAGIIARD